MSLAPHAWRNALLVEDAEGLPDRVAGDRIAAGGQEDGLQRHAAAGAEEAAQEDVPVFGDDHLIPVADVVERAGS